MGTDHLAGQREASFEDSTFVRIEAAAVSDPDPAAIAFQVQVLRDALRELEREGGILDPHPGGVLVSGGLLNLQRTRGYYERRRRRKP